MDFRTYTRILKLNDMKTFTTIEKNKHILVLTDPDNRINSPYATANFDGTHRALCGVLKKGESLKAWIKRRFGK